MSKIVELQQKRAAVLKQMEELNAPILAEKRGMTADEETKWQRMDTEAQQLTSEITNEQRSADLQKRQADLAISTGSAAPAGDDAPNSTELRSAFDQYVRGGMKSLSPEQRDLIHQRAATDPNVTTTDPEGGHLVPEQWDATIIKIMKQYGSLLSEARIINTAGGGAYNMPTNDDTSNKAIILAEAATDTVQQANFGNKVLGAYKYTSKGILVSRELLQDAAYNVENEIGAMMGERMGRGTNEHFTTGTGTAQPEGIVTGSDVGTTAAAITRTSILDLIHSIDPAYRASSRFRLSFNDETLAAIRKLSIGSADDRPLWQPSMIVGEPDRIEGVQYFVNQDMAGPDSGEKCIIAGDMDQFAIRRVLAPTLLRSAERYIERDLVAFFMFARFDSKVLVSNAIKHLAIA